MGLRRVRAMVAILLLAGGVTACVTRPDASGPQSLADLNLRPCGPPPAQARSGAANPLRFSEVAGALAFDGRHWEAAVHDVAGQDASHAERDRGAREEAAVMSAGAAVADIDRDGWEDVFLTRVGYPNQLYRNECGAGFRDIAGNVGLAGNEGSASAVWGDVDKDADLDLFVTSLFRQPNQLYLNRGDGSFIEQATSRGAGSRGDFTPATNMSYGAAFGDVDGDGDLDLVVSQWQPANQHLRRGRTRVLVNDGRGHFSDATQRLGLAFGDVAAFVATIEDIDDDGITDLLVTGDWGSSRLLLGTAGGTFRDATRDAGVGTDENGMGSAVEDIDGDGDLDWFVTAIRGTDCSAVEFGCSGNRLYRNDGGGRFTDATDASGLRDGGWGWGTAVEDFDNDGDRDVVMTNGFESQGAYSEGSQAADYGPFVSDPMRYFMNDGTGLFRERAGAVGLSDRGLGKALVPFDFDRDGDLDIVVARTGQTPLLYRNDVVNEYRWLRVVPVGADGLPVVGARVTVHRTAGAPALRDHVRAGDTYGGSNSAWLHFGLGDHPGRLEVRVRWPGGAGETVVRDVEPDRELIVSPKGPVAGG